VGALQSLPEPYRTVRPILKELCSQAEYHRIRCVWLCITLGLSPQQVAAVMAWRASSVRHVRPLWAERRKILRDQQGGSYHTHLRAEEQRALLALLKKLAIGSQHGHPLRQVYDEKLGRPIIIRSFILRFIAKDGARSTPSEAPETWSRAAARAKASGTGARRGKAKRTCLLPSTQCVTFARWDFLAPATS
jgi:hypothetical protein